MPRIIDLSVKLEDFMPSHKNLQRPFVKPHVTHEDSKSKKLGTPKTDDVHNDLHGDGRPTGTHVDAFYNNNPDGCRGRDAAGHVHGEGRGAGPAPHSRPGDVDVKDMEAAERKAGVRIDGHIVLICSGFTPGTIRTTRRP